MLNLLCIFSSAWLCQQTSWYGFLSFVCLPSVAHPCCNYLRSCWAVSYQIFSFRLPWGWTRVEMDTFDKNHIFWFYFLFCEFFHFSLKLDPTGTRTSKRYSSLKSLWNYLNFCWFLFWVVLTKVLFLTFEILSFRLFHILFSFSLSCDPMGAKTSKSYSPFKSLLNHFKLFLNFLLSGNHKSTVLDFWHFLVFEFFIIFFLFPFTWDHMGTKTSKHYSPVKSFLHHFNFLWILFSVVLTKYYLGFLKFWVYNLRFLTIFLKFTILPYG